MSDVPSNRTFRRGFAKGPRMTPHLFNARASSRLASVMSGILRRSFPDEISRAKTIARVTKTTPRAAQNWLDELNTMGAEALLNLMAGNDRALQEILEHIGRFDMADAGKRAEIAKKLDAAVAAIKESVG